MYPRLGTSVLGEGSASGVFVPTGRTALLQEANSYVFEQRFGAFGASFKPTQQLLVAVG